MSPPRAARLKTRPSDYARAENARAAAPRRHEKQDECYVETCKVLMILPHPLARGRISMAPLARRHVWYIKINDTKIELKSRLKQ